MKKENLTHKIVKDTARSGFTLVELLLVVAIIGTLAAVVATNLAGQSEGAKINATRASIKAIESAVATFEVKMGRFPESLDELTVGSDSAAPLLKKGTLNDSWATPFAYKKVGRYEFEIRSAGPDTQMNTEDDITN